MEPKFKLNLQAQFAILSTNGALLSAAGKHRFSNGNVKKRFDAYINTVYLLCHRITIRRVSIHVNTYALNETRANTHATLTRRHASRIIGLHIHDGTGAFACIFDGVIYLVINLVINLPQEDDNENTCRIVVYLLFFVLCAAV